MTRRRLLLSALGLSFYLTGCGGGGGKKSNNDQPSEPLPSNLDRSASVAGTDSGGDGIRDDVASLINQYPLSDTQRQNCRTIAQLLQASILTTDNDETSIATAQAMITAISQLANSASTADATRYLNRMVAYTFNTPERAAAYLAFEANLHGTVLRPTFSNAETSRSRATDVCTSSGFVCGYINGVLADAPHAWLSLVMIRSQIGETFNNESISYENYWNPTDGFISDFLESAKQKFAELGITYAMELAWAILLGDDGLVATISSVLSSTFPNVARLIEELRHVFNSAAAAVGSIGPNPEPVISRIVSAVNVNITERKKVLLVAHSQGNFFANEVYDRIHPGLQENSLAVVHIATPTSSVRGAYTTSSNDIVIGAVPTALPSNITVPRTLTDVTGHGLNEIYLNPAFVAKAKINADFHTALGSLVAPSTGGASGFFTVTLTWDGAGDVDLHVTEPNGTHVYYSNKQGTSGYLDVDNTTANGPEHYFANCNSDVLQTGVYQVGINNYSGATGRIATVTLATQDRIYQPVTLGVGAVRGSSGNSSPISVLSVRVDQDSQGRYTAVLNSTRSRNLEPQLLHTYALPNDEK